MQPPFARHDVSAGFCPSMAQQLLLFVLLLLLLPLLPLRQLPLRFPECYAANAQLYLSK